MIESAKPLFQALKSTTEIENSEQLLGNKRPSGDEGSDGELRAIDMLARLHTDMGEFYDSVYLPHLRSINPYMDPPQFSTMMSEYMGQLSILTEQDHIDTARALIQDAIDSGNPKIYLFVDNAYGDEDLTSSDKYMSELIQSVMENDYPDNEMVIEIVNEDNLDQYSFNPNDSIYIIDDGAYSGVQKGSLVSWLREDPVTSNTHSVTLKLFFAGSTRRAKRSIEEKGNHDRAVTHVYYTKEIPDFSDLSEETQHFVASYVLHKSELVKIDQQNSPSPDNRQLTYIQTFMHLLARFAATITAHKVPDDISIFKPKTFHRPFKDRSGRFDDLDPWGDMLYVFNDNYKNYPSISLKRKKARLSLKGLVLALLRRL